MENASHIASSFVRGCILAVVLALPSWAGFTSTNFTVGGDSRTVTANGFATLPTGFTSTTDSDIRSTSAVTPPVPGPTAPDLFDTSAQTGGLSFDMRQAGTAGSANGIADQGETISFFSQSFATVRNRDVENAHYKGTAVSTVSFVGEVEAPADLPGIAIGYDGIYSMQAFAANNAPGGFNNNSGYASVEASIIVENVTAATQVGQVVFLDEMISQVFCGPQGSCFPNNSLANPFSGTVFIPVGTHNDGDVFRITIDTVAASDAYAKGFNDPSGGNQTAGANAFARFDEVNVTFLLIPEPASFSLMLLGTASIGLLRRRIGSRA